MANITQEFTYKLADDYLAQTDDLGKTATWTYEGRDKLWLEINRETGELDNTGYFKEEEGGGDVPTDPHLEVICVDCTIDPLICSLVGADKDRDYAELPQYTEELPDGSTYSRPDPVTPDHTYDINTAVYDKETETWSMDYYKTWRTWEEVIADRDNLLKEVKKEVKAAIEDSPASYVEALQAHQTALENLETTWAGYEEDHQAIKVIVPLHPFK